ncbi:MAG: aromatic amino acid transport family protein [Patescibacteria group bacterium]
MFNRKFFFATASFIGAMVGAGVFGIPYAVARAGFWPGFICLVFLGGVAWLLHLVCGEVALRTQGKQRLPGYTKKYLGQSAYWLAVFSAIFGICAALLAYIILAADFVSLLFPSLASFNVLIAIVFWAILSIGVWRGLKAVAAVELVMAVLLIGVMVAIVAWGGPKINIAHFSGIDYQQLFLPYGVILFAFIGIAAIPEIEEILLSSSGQHNAKSGRIFIWAISLGSLIPLLLYAGFTAVVVGVSGQNVSPDALKGLSPYLGSGIVRLGALFGILAITTSYLFWAINLKNTLIHDLNINKRLADIFIAVAPIALFLAGLRSFIGVIGVAGAFIGVIDGGLILLAFRKAKTMGDRQPEYSLKIPGFVLFLLLAVLLAGALSQIIILIK